MPGGLGDAGFELVWAVALRLIRNVSESSGRSWAGCGRRTDGIPVLSPALRAVYDTQIESSDGKFT